MSTSPSAVEPAETTGPQVDPRGQRFAAWLTTAVLVVVLVSTPSTLATVLLAAQSLVFLSGVALGPARTPYSWLFRTLVRPRIGPPAETEPAQPPRFAQGVGLVFAVVALAGAVAGIAAITYVAAGMALGAAFLNAACGFCRGCALSLLGLRFLPRDRLSHDAAVLRDSAGH